MASDGEISCTNDPNFAIIYSFLKVFGKLYSLDVPSIVKLQELIENTEEVLEPLKELHLRLLRRALKSVQSNKWERALIKFCHQRNYHQEAWELERFSYKKASTPVKLKILKLLLEYQFTCHPKFKNAVNALSCKDLRIDPIGSDKNGCVYWLQVDDDANVCLYKEDQDEETWQLIARNKEELAKVIDQLKRGEDISPSCPIYANEDTNSGEISITPQEISENKKPQLEDDNDEEFLSPESESDLENDDLETDDASKIESELKDTKTVEESQTTVEDEVESENNDNSNDKEPDVNEGSDSILCVNEQDQEILESKSNVSDKPSPEQEITKSPESIIEKNESQDEILENESNGDITECVKSVPKDENEEEFSEAIEEPVMIITGEGSGVECESSFFLSEEICEPVMYIYGDGSGYDNDTGNPDIIKQENNTNEITEEENEEESLNGEVVHELSNQGAKTRSGKSGKVRTSVPAVTRRRLKKQSNDSSESPKSDSKKHCIRDLDLDKSSTSNPDVNFQQTETPNKNIIKKGRAKIKQKMQQKKNHLSNEENNSTDKTSIIEKRKSSVSSIEQEDGEYIEAEKEKSPDRETKVDDTLPTKKLRLEASPESDVGISHSNDVNNIDNVNNEESDKETVNNGIKTIENEVILKRKKITPVKGKHKKIRKTPNKEDNELNDMSSNDSNKKSNKSLKRTIMDATMSDKNKTESPTESDADEEVTSGKRLKIKPKKIIMSSRKKVEAKLQEKNSSDESEEETLYSLAGKKGAKKSLKKKLKSKEKVDPKIKQSQSDESDLAPVRQSRRIAQLKIKEEADRRNMEEVALKELKKIHKKKNHDDEEEWKASGASSSEAEVSARKKMDKWRNRSVSTGPEPDSESDEPIFEHEEPDLVFTKSDHEFSPESDLESGEPVEPAKLARTLQKADVKDNGFCKRCGSGEQPEWILLCDQCDDGYHASCLKPMLFLIPEGDWFCPPCNHQKLIEALEKELVKIDELSATVEAEKARKLLEEPPKVEEKQHVPEKPGDGKTEGDESGSGSDWSSTSEEGAVYRLRARKQLPVSYRSQEYDRLISSAIKEEYVEPTSSAGNQGRGKDISTIIEAAEEEKLKAEREALEQGKPLEMKKKKRQRRKPRKLNSLDVPSEDDGETDEDFKDTGMESSSESISTSAERATSSATNSSDDLPIRRTCRSDKKGSERVNMTESSPEVKKKKKVFDSSSESGEKDKDWSKKSKSKKKSSKKRDRSGRKKSRKRSGLTQYDADGNVIRARVTYGGLSGDDDPNDWSPKHRTRQKKINYTEMPNTESEDEMHKSSGKHMLDSSDEFKITSDSTSDSDAEKKKKKEKKEAEEQSSEEKKKALCDLIKKTAVVPLEKLPEDVTKAKTEELQAHLLAASQSSSALKSSRGKGHRGRGHRGGGSGARGRSSRAPVPVAPPPDPDDELAKLVGVKIKDLRQDDAITPLQAERERKRQEREAKLAEKEAKRLERLQKKEEKEKMKEQKAKEREEKRLARIALQESKRVKKEAPMGYAIPVRPMSQEPPMRGPFTNSPIPIRHPNAGEFPERFPAVPRLQVRAELRGVLTSEERLLHRPEHQVMREGTLSVAGSPQPFKPVSEEPSIITRMPHMLNQQYRGQMYPNNSPYGPRTPQNMMYSMHHMNQNVGRPQYPPQGYYPHMRGLPPGYPTQQAMRSTGANQATSPGFTHRQLVPQQMHRPPVSSPLAHPLQHRPHHLAMQFNAPPSTPPVKPPTPGEMPIKIKAEVKTEPEYTSPPTSPQRPPSPKQEPVRNHPKIKHTESKDRKPRFPLGPYAPQYGPYGPYAPPPQPEHLLNLQSRMHQPHMPRMLPPGPHQYLPPGGMEEKPEQSRSPIQRMAQMERAQMERTQMERAQMERSQMERAQMERAQMERSQMERAQMERLQMERPPHHSMEPPQHPMSERQPYPTSSPHPMAERSPHPMSERSPHPMSERSPHPMSERSPHPMSERLPHPMSERSPHPMSERSPHPMSERSPHPMSESSPHPMSERSPHPMSERPPHPMSESSPHPMSERPPHPMSERSPHPMSENSPHPISERPPHPMSERSPHPMSENSPHPMSDRPPHPMSERSPHPNSERSPHPMSERPPHPMSIRSPHPMSERSPHPMSIRSPHPMSERSPHPMSERPAHPMSERSPHPMSERPPHPMSIRSPHPMSERSPHPMSERPGHPMSERSPHPMSERSPHPMSERPGHPMSERSPHPMSERSAHPLSDRPPHHLLDRPPHLADRPPHIPERPPHLIPDRPPHPSSEHMPHHVLRPPHPLSDRQAHHLMNRPPHPMSPMSERPPHLMAERPQHPLLNLNRPQMHMQDRAHHHLAERLSQPSERTMHPMSDRSPHEFMAQDRHPHPLSERPSHPLSDRPQHPSSDRSPHHLTEHLLHPIPEHSPHNLSERPHHLSDHPAQSGERPQHLMSERPPHPTSGHLSHVLGDRPPHEMTRMPPHFLPPPHLQSQLRPQYGMPMMRHPGRNSPGSIPPHYPQHFPDLHKLSAEKPVNPAVPQPEKPQSPGSEKEFHEPNGQTVPQIKKENIDNDQPPSPEPPETSQPLHKLEDQVNRALDNEPLKQLQEIKSEEKDEEDEVDEPPAREEGSVFGGLVSYFSSQREDDIDS